MKNGRESLKLIFKKGLKTWNPNFRLEVSNQENSRMPFQKFRFLQEFSTETSKATRNWVNGKPHVAFSVLRARKGKIFEKNYCTNT